MAHVQRNVVTLSNIPPDLHQWLREEAFRQSEKAGKKVGIYNIVVQAIQKYQTDLEVNPTGHKEVASVTN